MRVKVAYKDNEKDMLQALPFYTLENAGCKVSVKIKQATNKDRNNHAYINVVRANPKKEK